MLTINNEYKWMPGHWTPKKIGFIFINGEWICDSIQYWPCDPKGHVSTKQILWSAVINDRTPDAHLTPNSIMKHDGQAI